LRRASRRCARPPRPVIHRPDTISHPHDRAWAACPEPPTAALNTTLTVLLDGSTDRG
jgi:hypothetical protein